MAWDLESPRYVSLIWDICAWDVPREGLKISMGVLEM